MATTAGSQHRCVFVGNIPYDASEEQLIQICEEVGPVVSFRLVLDRETGKPKGYGFCEYKDEETALSARRNLQGYEINGRQLRVDFAENDKGVDRNRDQGRGGPGLASTNDAQKALPKPAIPMDLSLHQPIGHPLAATAASHMARSLGGVQISGSPLMQNGLQIMSGLGNDPLTQYLAKMSRNQLNEILAEMKALAVQNKPLAQQLLQECPQIPKALFQAQIMLGMVPPQMMQMANARQPSSSVPQPTIQNNITTQNQLPPPYPLQTPIIPQQPSFPHQNLMVQPPIQAPTRPGIIMMPPTVGNLSNQPQAPPLQMQPPIVQHSRPPTTSSVGHYSQPPNPHSHQQAYLPPPMTSQTGPSNHPALPNELNLLPKEGGTYASPSHETSDTINHRTKRPKLETNNFSSNSSVPPQLITTGSIPGNQMVNVQHSETQTPQLPPEVESALLQQVMNITPEQLSSLPLEQQQQVVQLQQMLAKQNL